MADCAVSVSNARDAARWWKEKVGFSVYTVGTNGHAVMVAPAGDHYMLHLCEGFEPVQPGNTGVAFVTDEIDAWVGRMQRAGVRFTEPLSRGDWGAKAMFADPDGNVFWAIEAPTAFITTEGRRRAPARPARARASARSRSRPRAARRAR
ncbi:MAG TPA: VOC family protein [Thermoplasmata archaeon]|nr:VOC family protein [Thermoplasmata archaeon]